VSPCRCPHFFAPSGNNCSAPFFFRINILDQQNSVQPEKGKKKRASRSKRSAQIELSTSIIRVRGGGGAWLPRIKYRMGLVDLGSPRPSTSGYRLSRVKISGLAGLRQICVWQGHSGVLLDCSSGLNVSSKSVVNFRKRICVRKLTQGVILPISSAVRIVTDWAPFGLLATMSQLLGVRSKGLGELRKARGRFLQVTPMVFLSSTGRQ